MENSKKIALLEEMMELDQGTLSEETKLGDIEEYDSMAKLSLIVLMNDEFGKKLNSNQIKGFQTVKDILEFME
jgi:acyl carrier protein